MPDIGLIGPLAKVWGHIVLLAAQEAYNLPVTNAEAISEITAAIEHFSNNSTAGATAACTQPVRREITEFVLAISDVLAALRIQSPTASWDPAILQVARSRFADLATSLDRELTGVENASTDTQI